MLSLLGNTVHLGSVNQSTYSRYLSEHAHVLTPPGDSWVLASPHRAVTVAPADLTRKAQQPGDGMIIGPDGKLRLRAAVFKPYKGDLFGAFDNSGGMLYLSRIHYGTSPAKKFVVVSSERAQRNSVIADERKRDVAAPVWRNPHALDRKRRFAVSLSTLAAKPEKRRLIVKEGALPVLIKLAQLRDRHIISSCSQAFYNLALEPDLRKAVIETGCVPTIISLMLFPNRKVKLECAQTLCNLAACRGFEGRLVSDGIMPALGTLTSMPSERMTLDRVLLDLMTIAIMTLLNLSCVEEKFPKIEEVDVAALDYTLWPLSNQMELLLLKCLCNLTGLKGNQARLIEDMLVENVASIARNTTQMETKILCAKIVSNLATDVRSRSKMVDHRVVQAILEFLKTGSPDIEQQCALTMTRLAGDQTCREKLIQYGAVQAILEMSTRPNMHLETCRACAAALKTFTSDREIARRVVDGNGIKALIGLIDSVEDQVTRQDCLRSLCWLFQYEDTVARLIDDGAVASIVKMANPRDQICSSYCASALYALSWHPACTPAVMNTRVIEALNVLCDADSPDTRRRCVATLWSLTQQPGKSDDPNISIPALLRLLRREPDSDIMRLCAAALCNLAKDIANCQRMLDEGAVMPIIGLCNSENTYTKIQCGAILCRLSAESKNRPALISLEYIRTLLQLAKVEDRCTQQRSVIALVNMSQEPEARKLLLRLDAPLCLVQLSNKPDELIRRGCSAALCNLAYEVGCEAEIVKTGAVSCLLIIALVATDNQDAKTTCTKGVFNLLYDEKQHPSMIEDEVVWGFAMLSNTGRPEVSKMCATALCNLSIRYSAQVLSSSSTRAIFNLMNGSGELETQKLAAQALANLLSKTCTLEGNARFKTSAVNVLKETVKSPDREVALLSARCMTYISVTSTGRQAIISEGAITNLDFELMTSTNEAARNYALLVAHMAVGEDSRAKAVEAGALNGLIVLSQEGIADEVIATCCVRALYSLSCDAASLVALSNAGTIEAETSFFTSLEEVTPELRLLGAATIYNLTTNDAILADLVTQGIVKFMRDFLWVSENREIKRMCALASCHMGCGYVNTSRMVNDGVGPMLIHLCKPTDDADLGRRVSSAFRNILLVNGNHETLVTDGVITAIVELFSAEDIMTKQHCGASLRNITYNKRFRRLLVESGAISVIIEDSKMEDDEDEDDLPLNMNLLFEIEAESWSNGSRGRQREGRAPVIRSLPLNRGFLNKCACGSFIQSTEITAPWYKLMSELGLTDEPPFDLTSDFSPSSFSALMQVKAERDRDVDFKTHIMVGGKVECPLAPSRTPEVITPGGPPQPSSGGGTASSSSEPLKQLVKKRETGDPVSASPPGADPSAPAPAPEGAPAPGSGQKRIEFDMGPATVAGDVGGTAGTGSSGVAMEGFGDVRKGPGRDAQSLGDSSGSQSMLLRSATFKGNARDKGIDELIKTFKRSKTVEGLLEEHRKQKVEQKRQAQLSAVKLMRSSKRSLMDRQASDTNRTGSTAFTDVNNPEAFPAGADDPEQAFAGSGRLGDTGTGWGEGEGQGGNLTRGGSLRP
jgi:hypothetical protein